MIRDDRSARIRGLDEGVPGFDKVIVLPPDEDLLRQRHTADHERYVGFAVYAGGRADAWHWVRPAEVAIALATSLRQTSGVSTTNIYAATSEVKFDHSHNRDVTTLTLGAEVTAELVANSPELLLAYARGQSPKSTRWNPERARS